MMPVTRLNFQRFGLDGAVLLNSLVAFERALAQLHSFDFPDTLKSFAAIPQTDPGCAISYWGLAVATRPNPLVGPWDAATLKRGLDAVEKGEAIGAMTKRECEWLMAIKTCYKNLDYI